MVTKLRYILTRRDIVHILLLMAVLVLRACLEFVGIGSVWPLMSAIADPSTIAHTPLLAYLYGAFRFTTYDSFVVVLGLAVVILIAVSSLVSALAIYGVLRMSAAVQHRLSTRLFALYVTQGYSFFLSSNSAALTKQILAETHQVASGVLTPALSIASRGLVVLAISALVIALDPVASVALAALAAIYVALYLGVRARQRRLGTTRFEANNARYRAISEAFGGIKALKVVGRESAYLSRFTPASWAYLRSGVSSGALAQLPRYALETLAFAVIVSFLLLSARAGTAVTAVIPTLGVYAYAAYRLMPEAQQLFAAAAQMRFSEHALDSIVADLRRLSAVERPLADPLLRFDHSIRLDSVTFRYAGSATPQLSHVTLTIPKNTRVGIIGSSGSGKTTLLDLIIGLLEPSEGAVLVDDVPLDPRRARAWRRSVGYVAQDTFLADASIAANIAFGIRPEQIDMDAVQRAARWASLHDFVSSLPGGYNAHVGERGMRLSGGQRQRIGIARALYDDPQLLVLDEATSALDRQTEQNILFAIDTIAVDRTVLIVAHRASTVQTCDLLYRIDNGALSLLTDHDRLDTAGSDDDCQDLRIARSAPSQLAV